LGEVAALTPGPWLHIGGDEAFKVPADAYARFVARTQGIVAATDTDGVSHSFEGGHYISVVGYDDGGKTVTIADSANPDQASSRIDVDALAHWIASRGYAS
ncbi:hypothetical protein QLR68_06715, partial [Micromonospora sp. DH15]|nr:hypothetical protein [Micromonospora sp. DH15]